jgi:hypothetical protein
MSGLLPAWQTCPHDFPILHELRYPDGEKYGVLAVCFHCRCRRVTDWDGWTTRYMPPIPRRSEFKGGMLRWLIGLR